MARPQRAIASSVSAAFVGDAGRLGVPGARRDALVAEDALDLEARYVLAPSPEVVGRAVDEEQVPLVVDPADVAGVVPPVAAGLHRRLRPPPVALEHRVRALGADHDLALGARRQLVVVVV